MNLSHKIIYGLSDIYICPQNGNPVKLDGAIDVNIKVSRNSIYIRKNGDKSERIDTSVDASGTLSLLSLDFNARSLILGHQIINNGLAVTLGTPPRVALMFSREKANGHKLYHVFYNVQFKEDSLKARTFEGSREKDIVSIDFDVFRDKDKNLIYYVIDTETANKDLIDNWFSKVTYPEGL